MYETSSEKLVPAICAETEVRSNAVPSSFVEVADILSTVVSLSTTSIVSSALILNPLVIAINWSADDFESCPAIAPITVAD